MNPFSRSILIAASLAAVLAGCTGSPDYSEVPTAKIPASAVPKGPPPAPPAGQTAAGNAPNYAGSVAPSGPAATPPPSR